MVLAKSWVKRRYLYTSDKGRVVTVDCNDYLGDAAGLEPYDQHVHGLIDLTYGGERLRYVKVRSKNKNDKGKYDHTQLVVQADSLLWQKPLGQTVFVAGQEMETTEKCPEKSRWLK
jgi:hypothetical protein